MPGSKLEMIELAPSGSESEPSELTPTPGRPSARWVKVGVIAAASALAGGLAFAWWYRKTLKTLRQTGETGQNPQFGIPSDDRTNG